MSDRDARIEELSPARRALLQRLVAAGRHTPPASASPPPAPGRPRLRPVSSLTGEKETARCFYDAVNEQLNASPFGAYSFFLNYGYVSDGSAEFAVVALPEHYLNRNSVKLVLEVIGDCPVDGADVLDVGCGRGGTVVVLQSFFAPRRIAALDLSPEAVRWCRATHHFANVSFEEGDGERLPYDDGTFDVVTNIESSHLYPDVDAFYREAFRALRPGGHFRYADLQPAGRMRANVLRLRDVGFRVQHERDITANVVRSCDEVAQHRVEAYAIADERRTDERRTLEEFLSTPGSRVYTDLHRRAWTYHIVAAVKP